MGCRCAPISYLRIAGAVREWKGIPSTTQMLNGTREEYLKITEDYSIIPDKRAFAALGTKTHAALDSEDNLSFSEERLFDETGSGQMDRLELQENGEWWLIEEKTSGSRKVAQAMGLVKKKRPAFYPSGDPVLYQRSGKGYKAGDQKTETYFELGGEKDCYD